MNPHSTSPLPADIRRFTSAKVSGLATPLAMPTASVILAIDLGKYKCVPCVHEASSGEFRFTTFDTSGEGMKKIVDKDLLDFHATIFDVNGDGSLVSGPCGFGRSLALGFIFLGIIQKRCGSLCAGGRNAQTI